MRQPVLLPDAIDSTDGGALSDLIAECVREEQHRWVTAAEVARRTTSPSSSPQRGSQSRTAEALVMMVRREARAAASREMASLLKRLESRKEPSDVKELLQSESSGCQEPQQSKIDVPLESSPCKNVATEAAFVHGLEGKLSQHKRSLNGLKATVSQCQERWDAIWKQEAELRAEGDAEVQARIVERFETLEAQVGLLQESLSSVMNVQLDLGAEAQLRQDSDAHLQTFLRDFREHVVGEIEELSTGHRQVVSSLEGVRGLVAKVVALVELQSEQGAHCRVTGPDELAEVSFRQQEAFGLEAGPLRSQAERYQTPDLAIKRRTS